MKTAMELVLPLIAQAGRRQDERAVGDTALTEFSDEDARLNRFSKTDVVCEQKPAAVAAKHRHRRFELVRQDVDGRRAGDVKKPRNSRAADERAGGATPASRTDALDGRGRRRNRLDLIERAEELTRRRVVCADAG